MFVCTGSQIGPWTREIVLPESDDVNDSWVKSLLDCGVLQSETMSSDVSLLIAKILFSTPDCCVTCMGCETMTFSSRGTGECAISVSCTSEEIFPLRCCGTT